MLELVIYIHGKGGSAEESEHYSFEEEISEKKNHASDKGKKITCHWFRR